VVWRTLFALRVAVEASLITGVMLFVAILALIWMTERVTLSDDVLRGIAIVYAVIWAIVKFAYILWRMNGTQR
jgi:hypothetical protein